MKKNIATCLLFAILALVSHTVVAQTDPLLPLRQQLDSVFQYIDKTQIPTGYLLENGIQFANPLGLNGQINDSNQVNLAAWYAAYNGIYTSHIHSAQVLPALATLKPQIEAKQDTVLLPVFYLAYNTLREDALSAGLMTLNANNQLLDVLPRIQSPYLPKWSFAMAPALSRSVSGTVRFMVDPALYVTNTTATIVQVSIDFGIGSGYIPVGIGQVVSINYATAGTKQLKYQVEFSDGVIATGHSTFLVENASPAGTVDPQFIVANNQPEPFPANLTHSGGVVSFIRAESNTTNRFIKPLIVLEGFDPENRYGFFELIRDLRAITSQSNNFNFFRDLDDVGNYDLIFINYNNGADFIERNAALFQEVLAWVNANKITDGNGVRQENVVMGISMGGLVARYGLVKLAVKLLLFVNRNSKNFQSLAMWSTFLLPNHLVIK